MAIDPNIKKKADDIRNKIYGREVRESLASGLEEMSSDVVETVGRQDEVESQFQDVIENTTDKDVISAPEIIAARGGEANLKARLDKEHQDVTAQLAHITTYVNPDMTLEEIQDIVYRSNRIVFRKGSYKWDIPSVAGGRVLNVPSDATIEFELGAKIELLPHTSQHYRIMNLEDVENVVLKNVRIDGRRDLNGATEGEWGMGVSIRGTKNIHLENVETNNCWGDGIYIGSTENQNYAEETYLTNIKADNNRRQGISVISVKGLYGDNALLSNTNGTAPEAGIDFEPNDNTEFLEGIRFNNIRTENNSGAGILFFLGALGDGDLVKQIDVEINGHVNKDSYAFIYEVVEDKIHGSIKINQPLWIDSPNGVVRARNFFSPNFTVEINQPTIMNPNTMGMESEVWDSLFSLRDTSDSGRTLKNLIIRELNVITNETPSYMFHIGGLVNGIYFIDPIQTGGLNRLNVGNRGVHVTDKHRVLERYMESSLSVDRYNYSSVIHNENVTRKITLTLGSNLEVGYPDLTFENRSNTYDMDIIIDANSILSPLTNVKGSRITLKPGSRISIRKITQDSWQVLNLVGEYDLYEPV